MESTVNAVMFVYRGDEYWRNSLNALATCRDLFKDVIVSFDGPTRAQLAEQLLDDFGGTLRPNVLITPQPMTSVEHFIWFTQQSPIREWQPDQLVMLMAEDDLPIREPLSAGLAALEREPQAILFGPWVDHGPLSGRVIDNLGTAHSVATTLHGPSRARRLEKVARNGGPTSISGLTLSAIGLRSLGQQFQGQDGRRPLLNGIRTEYFLATQPSVRSLIYVDRPIFGIQAHPQQEGQITPRSMMCHDEALYQLWLLLGSPHISIQQRMRALLRLGKRLVLCPTVLRDFPNAVRTYQEVRRAA